MLEAEESSITATIGLFRAASDFRPVPAGEVIFRAGDEAHEMYVVLEGEVDIRLGDLLLDTVGPGGLFGELALIDSAPRSADAVAKTDAKIIPISERRFTFLLQQTPGFAIQVMRVMADRLRRKDPRPGPGAVPGPAEDTSLPTPASA